MNDILSQLAQRLNLPVAGIAAGAGGIAFGGIYLSFSGLFLGVVLALGLLGVTAVMISLISPGVDGSIGPAMAGAGAPLSALAPSMPSTSHAVAQTVMASTSSGPTGGPMRTVDSTLPAGAPVEPAKIEATETEAELLNAGRFAEYHLAKAKRFFASNNAKEAAYQAAASLAHGDLPEAKELRTKALAVAKR